MTQHNMSKSTPSLEHFEFVVIDENDHLQDCYALRYSVYCLEKGFLPSENYPDKLETDIFDNHSIHVGCLDKNNTLIGTLRLVLHSPRGFPLIKHCKMFDKYGYITDPYNRQLAKIAEISRLAITKPYRRRYGDGLYGYVDSDDEAEPSTHNAQTLHRRHRSEIVLGLYKAMYQISKRQGITHWIAAMERPLMRLLSRHHFRWHAIGPEVDYFGPVTPYMATISSIEEKVHKASPKVFRDFVDGLEPEYLPDIAKCK